MTDSNKTLIVTILDRSGSMMGIKLDMEGGFKAFIDEQKAQPGECLVSLYQFDNIYEAVFENKPIAEVGALTLTPRGGTALLDAIGRTITTVGEHLGALPEDKRPGAVIVQVITDGEENASREFSLDVVRGMIERQQKEYNWQFVYLGAGLSTLNDASKLGIAQAAQYQASSAGVKGMYEGTSRAAALYRSAVRSGSKDAKLDLPEDMKKP